MVVTIEFKTVENKDYFIKEAISLGQWGDKIYDIYFIFFKNLKYKIIILKNLIK